MLTGSPASYIVSHRDSQCRPLNTALCRPTTGATFRRVMVIAGVYILWAGVAIFGKLPNSPKISLCILRRTVYSLSNEI